MELVKITPEMYSDGGIFIGYRLNPISCMALLNYSFSLTNVDKYGKNALPKDCLVPPDEYHITLIVSKIVPESYPLSDEADSYVRGYQLRYIGKALAIICESPFLRWKFQIAKLLGMKSDFGGYIPHISIAYDPPKSLILPKFEQPDFNLKLNGEYTEPMK